MLLCHTLCTVTTKLKALRDHGECMEAQQLRWTRILDLTNLKTVEVERTILVSEGGHGFERKARRIRILDLFLPTDRVLVKKG